MSDDLTQGIKRLVAAERRRMNRILAQDKTVRDAVGPRPVKIALLVRRELWEARKDAIRQELSKLGAVAVFDED